MTPTKTKSEKKVCPECGISLTDIDPKKHAKAHWGDEVPKDPRYEEARRRRKKLEE